MIPNIFPSNILCLETKTISNDLSYGNRFIALTLLRPIIYITLIACRNIQI